MIKPVTTFRIGVAAFALCAALPLAGQSTAQSAKEPVETLVFFDPTVYKATEEQAARDKVEQVVQFVDSVPMGTKISIFVVDRQPEGQPIIHTTSPIDRTPGGPKRYAIWMRGLTDTLRTKLIGAWRSAHAPNTTNERRSCILTTLFTVGGYAHGTHLRVVLVTDLLESCEHWGHVNLEDGLHDTTNVDRGLLQAIDLSAVARLYVIKISHPSIVTPSQVTQLQEYWRRMFVSLKAPADRITFARSFPGLDFWR